MQEAHNLEPAQAARLVKRPRLRTLDQIAGERHASWFELFFDLVFVLAVARVAYALSHDMTSAGAVHFIVLFAFVWWAWIGYSFYADRFESDEAIYRLLMFAGMLGVAALAVNVRGAFTADAATPFVFSYVGVRFVLIALYARAAYHVPLAREFCMRYIAGFSIGGALWLLSAFASAPARYYLWAAGFAIELLTPMLSNRIINRTPYDASHIPERFGLFTIIVLGEAVVAAATGASEVEWQLPTMLTAAAGFSIAAALWWIHFEFVEDFAIRSGSTTARYIYLYGHFFTVAAIVATGIGAEHLITEGEQGAPTLATRIALCGGVAIFLLAITAIRLASGICQLLWVRAAAIACALLLLAVGGWLPSLALVSLVLCVLAVEVWIESRYDEAVMNDEQAAQNFAACLHVGEARVFATHKNGCEECQTDKNKWMHLRLCLVCGHVGCCDSSKGKHATAHFKATGHAIIKSLEQGEDWSWCYLDERFVRLNEATNSEAIN